MLQLTCSLNVTKGCSAVQANKIVELRPFSSADDLKQKLGQGRKKAGPAGISSRMFEDCTGIFAGYGTVDSIVTKCEKIAVSLRSEIAKWSTEPEGKGKAKEGSVSPRGSPAVAEAEGALSLRSQAALAARKPDYYISSQPAALSEDVQLKEYQMIGINWLNLLYNRKLSCILADEMGTCSSHAVVDRPAHGSNVRSWQDCPGHQLFRPSEEQGLQGSSPHRCTVSPVGPCCHHSP